MDITLISFYDWNSFKKLICSWFSWRNFSPTVYGKPCNSPFLCTVVGSFVCIKRKVLWEMVIHLNYNIDYCSGTLINDDCLLQLPQQVKQWVLWRLTSRQPPPFTLTAGSGSALPPPISPPYILILALHKLKFVYLKKKYWSMWLYCNRLLYHMINTLHVLKLFNSPSLPSLWHRVNKDWFPEHLMVQGH